MNGEIIFIVEARTTSCAAMTSGIIDQACVTLKAFTEAL